MFGSKNNYLLLEVENQESVKYINVNDGECDYGPEPRSVLELRNPDGFPFGSLAATLHGEDALHRFTKGDLVLVKLRFWKTKKYEEYVNHIDIKDIQLVQTL